MSGIELQCGSKAIRSREAFASRNSNRFFEVQSSGQSPSNPLPSSHSHHGHLSQPILDDGPDGPCEPSENRLSLLRILLGTYPKVNVPRTAETVVFDNVRTLIISYVARTMGGKEGKVREWMGTLDSEAVNAET